MALQAGRYTWRVTIAAAIFILMTLFILYSSSSGSIISISQAAYTPFQIAKNHTPKPTNLKTWATKDDYVPVYGDKLLHFTKEHYQKKTKHQPLYVKFGIFCATFCPLWLLSDNCHPCGQRMTQRCHHCALVSSSSHVLGTQAGEEIDSSECVIRMNDAPTTGYEADVGKRTTLRVVAHSSLYRVVRRPNEFMVVGAESQRTIIFWGPPNKMTKDSKATVYRAIQRISSTYKEVPCFTVAPEKMRKFDKLFQLETGRDRQKSNSWLSTGWFTMVIAIEICDNIKVYGMVPPYYCGNRTGSKKLPYHYYNPRGSDECMTYIQNQNNQKGGHHRFITEKQVFGHWSHQYNITFSHPTW